jgi:hypothetical protein
MKGGLPTWFAVPGGVRGLHRAIATAKSRYTKVARPATAKATVSSTTKFSMINFEKSHTIIVELLNLVRPYRSRSDLRSEI